MSRSHSAIRPRCFFTPPFDVGQTAVFVEGQVTSEGRIEMVIPNNSGGGPISFADFEFFGIPADPANGTGATGNPKALATNPTSCDQPVVQTVIHANSWENAAYDTMSAPAPGGTGCELLPFTPEAEVTTGNHAADSPTPLSVDIAVDQSGIADPNLLPQAHVKRVQFPKHPG